MFFKKLSSLVKLPKISYEDYIKLHTDYIVPLNLKIDLDLFNEEIKLYKDNFRRWGTRHTQYPRYGISLCNLTGKIDDEIDPCCYPLDEWAEINPLQVYWDTDFTKITPVFDLKSLSELHIFRPDLIRSNILLWNKTGHFKPHIDTIPEIITHLRLWGVNVDSGGYKLKYGNHIVKNIEPGRLYLIDTTKTHEAEALVDNVYTFFIALRLSSLEKLINLK